MSILNQALTQASGFIEITGSPANNYDIILTDITGRIVLKSPGNINQIDVSDFPEGLYFVRIKWDSEIIITKVIIQ